MNQTSRGASHIPSRHPASSAVEEESTAGVFGSAPATSQWVIEGQIYRTNDGHDRIPTPVGPFASRSDAATWLAGQRPFWGESAVVPLYVPLSMDASEGSTK